MKGTTSVSFSPDGTLLASGSRSWDDTIILWDVATRKRIATLEGHMAGWYTFPVTSVSFSALDGALLATGGWDGTVILWDVLKREKIVVFGHTDEIHSLSFSPDGTTLAAGGGDGTILLWNVSQWSGSRPHTVVKTSGDGQERPASTQLAAPFVVSVLDQDGSSLAGVTVSFSVTAGGGMLSSTTDANPCTVASSTSSTTATTDANGRAATRLTLGSDAGTNTVSATVEGLEAGDLYRYRRRASNAP